ncbi:MAG: hypothetical protein JXR70_19470 [Spirochaetales bacterium]|nr:hypothetical protein [Spirochaetales bacterium]
MKFKIIFAIFNIIILFSFVLFFTAPLFILGPDHFWEVISKYWPAFILFVIAFSLFNAYFIVNWKFFTLVEQEDWNALTRFLENEIFNNKLLRSHYLKILINSYLATSDMDGLYKLKDFLENLKPRLVYQYALAFGIPYLLAQNPEEAEKYYGKMLAYPWTPNRQWLRWNYGLSLMQQKQEESAQDIFIGLLYAKPAPPEPIVLENAIYLIFKENNPLVNLLSLYMLNSFSISADKQEKVKKAKDMFLKKQSIQRLSRSFERQKHNIEVICLASTIQKAISWLFPVAESTKKN